MRPLRVAIVHDWLYGGGAELVVEQLHKLYPNAPIYTSYCSKEWRKRLDNKVVTGYLQWWPFSRLRKFLVIPRQWWFCSLDLSRYDLVISSSGNGEAKFIKPKPGTIHMCYCHTPTHFYWAKYDEYMANPGFHPAWLIRLGLKLLVAPLRKRDFRAAQRVDYFIANSTYIQQNIKRFYKRDSTVIFPPVDTEKFLGHEHIVVKPRGFLIAGRQVPYKRFDIAVEACSAQNIPLTVIGDGPEHQRLRKIAGPSINFLGRVSDKVLVEEYAAATALIFPSLEDFGITPVEAIASGTPVIAYKAGGALDYVKPGVTGEFFGRQTADSLLHALGVFRAPTYKKTILQRSALDFSNEIFRDKILRFIADVMQKK